MAILRTNASDEFFRVTKYNITNYFQSFADFSTRNMNDIWRYYGGLMAVPNMSSFRNLDLLLETLI